jgi:hypothetical protein
MENLKRFNDYISRKALDGYAIVDKNTDNLVAVVQKEGKKINHILHLIITLSTCGLWGIVWAVLYFTNKPGDRIRVSFDESGNIVKEKIILLMMMICREQ